MATMVKMVLAGYAQRQSYIYTTWEIMDERPTVFPPWVFQQMSRA